MNRWLTISLTLFCLVALPALAAAEKIACVDLQRALNQSQAGKKAKEEIAKKLKEYEGTLTTRQDELKKLKEGLEKQSVVLSPEALAEKERDYQRKLKDFQRFTKDIQEELQQKDADYTRQIIESLIEIVTDIGKKEAYTLILEKSESSILFAQDSIDLTDRIIQAHDAKGPRK